MRKRTKEEIQQRDYLKMSELAEYCGVRYSTIKYYTELGLIPYEQKGDRLARYYPKEEASKRVSEILALRDKGKTIPEIITYFIGSK
jgi:DNA-binding transcriptional MerR regulator